MINESPKRVFAYWFFTPYTIPDKKVLDLLSPEKHEIALHIAIDPYREWKILENETNRSMKYFTIHGTSRVIAQLLWGRKIGEKQAKIPADFPLKSFHEFESITFMLDHAVNVNNREFVITELPKLIAENKFLAIHPEWLFNKGRINPRGPYYDILKSILDVDHDLETLQIKKKLSTKTAHDIQEYEKNTVPSEEYLEKLKERDIDVFTFLERKWCCPIPHTSKEWLKTDDNVALLEIKNYETWWTNVGKKTRNMVRRAEKEGVKVTAVEPSEKFVEGVWKIYNETPIRQERAFLHYGEPLEAVKGNVYGAQKSDFIGAYLHDELVGFIQILYGDNIAIIAQILSIQKYWDKAVNNALIAKAVEVCSSNGNRWLMYGRIGNHPSLDKFKESNGFFKFTIARYYVPLTWKGRVVIRIGLHRDLKDALPKPIKYTLIPVLNWLSRNKVRLKQL